MSEMNDPLFRALLVGALLSLPFKIVGLWKSARNNQKWWFGSMLVFNTVGILELVYLFYFSSPKSNGKKTSNNE